MIQGWYTIQASGDVNGNGIFARYAASSMNAELLIDGFVYGPLSAGADRRQNDETKPIRGPEAG